MSIREQYEGFIEHKNGFGPKGLSKRALKQSIEARKELPVLRVVKKTVHGQEVAVRVLPAGRAEGCSWWHQDCSSKRHHSPK